MKKFVALLMLGAFVGTPVAYAKKSDGKEKATPASVVEARKKVEALKTDLNGSSWEVALSPTDGKGKETKDELIFQNNQIAVKGFSGRGFKSTNYTITPPTSEGGTSVWETMQTSEKDGLLFIRGEWKEKDQVMRGLISHQKEGEPSQDYNFSSQAKVTLEPSTKAPAVAESAGAVVKAAEENVLVSKEPVKE